MEIQGKIAVVTGAASGIGSATAIALARKGADMVGGGSEPGRSGGGVEKG